MSNLIQLIYASSAAELFTEEELVALLHTSRVNNEKINVTGMLLYRDGNFLQVLEGDAQAVDRLYNIIAEDPRHTGVMLISRQTVKERIFPDWEMGFHNINQETVEQYPGFTDFLKTPFTPSYLADHPSRARIFLETFRNSANILR